jgi:SulP family sulfate permease
MQSIAKIFPIVLWMRTYKAGFAKHDLLAGLILGSFVLPEGLAYSALAGVPPQFGIYCVFSGCLAFSILTKTKQVAVGPTSAISLMVGSTVAILSGGDPIRWAAIASLTALVVFVLCIIAYLLKASSLVNFISTSILLGFKFGAALLITLTQLPKLLAVEGGGSNFFSKSTKLILEIPNTNLFVLCFGLSALALLVVGNYFLKDRPVSLLIVAGAILLVAIWPQTFSALPLVHPIPAGLPSVGVPAVGLSDVDGILALALGCFLMGYIETMAVARTFGEKNDHPVDARQELLSLGGANLAAGLTNGYPVSGGISQSTVNDKAGAKTPMALVVCSITLCVILLFFSDVFSYMPEVILAVIVIDAVSGLVKVSELRKLYRLSKPEFYVSATAILAVMSFGILRGVLIAAIVSIVYLIVRSSSPNVVVLGRIPGTNQFSDVLRHADNELIERCLIVRIESSLLYYNEQYVFERIRGLIVAIPDVRLVVVDLSSTPIIDVAGSVMIMKLQRELATKSISMKIVNALSGVRELLRAQGFEDAIGHISRRLTIDEAILEFEGSVQTGIAK